MLNEQPQIELSDWLQLDHTAPLRLRKEVLYADKFEKRDKNGVLEYKFEITPQILDHLSLSVNTLLQNGVEIPYASKHQGWELAENRWGDVVSPYRGKNAKGKDALFLDVQFSDEESMIKGKKANVSVGIPPVFFDGLGRRYTNPVRHLAATSAPVIPALAPWQAIAASFSEETFVPIIGDLAMPFTPPKKEDEGGQSGENKPAEQKPGEGEGGQQQSAPIPNSEPSIFDQILQVLELQIPAGADDKAKGVAILTALQMLKGKRQMAQQQQPGAPNQQKPVTGAAPGGGIQLSHENAPQIVGLVVQNREMMLSHLVENGILDSNAAKELGALYATQESVGLELSQGSDGSQFKKLVDVLANNKPVAKSGRTDQFSQDDIQLGHDGEVGKLSEMADKRAEEHKKQYGR